MENQKVCSKCGKLKAISEFSFRKDRGVYNTQCKICKRTQQKEYVLKNKDKIKETKKVYTKKNKDKIKYYQKEYRNNHMDKILKSNSEYYKNNKKEITLQKSEYYQKNKEKIIDTNKLYYKNNKKEIKEKRKLYKTNNKEKIALQKRQQQQRYLSTPIGKLTHNIRASIRRSLIASGYPKNTKTQEILGCSFEELKSHLELLFEPWMTWGNKGLYNGELNYGWDIDHIIPLSSAKTEDGIIRLNHYTNLQPLCSHINRDIKKNNLR